MQSSADKFCSGLSAINPKSKSLLSELYELTDLLEEETDLSTVYSDIFGFFENNPQLDSYALAPLVTLVEKSYPGYTVALATSLKSKPVSVTVNLLAGVLSFDLPAHERNEYSILLQFIAKSDEVDALAAKEAQQYFEHRRTKTS